VRSSLPDPVYEMSEAMAEERYGGVEWSNVVSGSDADQPRMLLRPPAPSGGYYEPGTANGGSFEQTTGQSLTQLLLIPTDARILSTSPTDLNSSGGKSIQPVKN